MTLTKLSGASIFALLIFAAPAFAQQPGYNCADAATFVERAICGDTALARLDRILNTEYRRAQSRLNSDEKEASAGFQHEWLAQRDACSDRGCLLDIYRDRIATLQRAARR